MIKRISFALITVWLIAANIHTQIKIDSIQIFKDKNGLYAMGILFNQKIDEQYFDVSKYKLADSAGMNIPLRSPLKWHLKGDGIKFTGLDLSYDKTYYLYFIGDNILIDKNNFRQLLKGEESYEKYEEQKSIGWKFTAAPVLIQSDSTQNTIGDLGLYWSVKAVITNTLNFNFEGTISSKKDDPSNNIKFNISYLWSLEQVIPGFLKMRPLCIHTQENTIQTLNYHDISGMVFTSIVLSPFPNLQNVYVTAGYEYANVAEKDKDPFQEGRINAEAQWGFAGLMGKGSGFFIDYQYWNRVSTSVSYDPSNKKERKLLSIELSVPVTDGKTLNLKYQDGDAAPTFINSTNVSLGLHIDLNGLNLL